MTFKTLLLIAALIPVLAGCEAAMFATAGTQLHKKFSDDAARPSMQAQNYMAADTLAMTARHKIDRFTPIRIGSFKNIGETPIDDKLGEAIGQELSERFIQLGYKVGQMQKEPGYMTRPDAILKWNYKIDRNNVNVDLIMFEEGSNQLLAKTNYDIPIKRRVRELGHLEDTSMNYLFNLDN